MPECEMLPDAKPILDELEDIDETTLFAAVRVMRKVDAELLKRRIEEASSACPSSLRLIEEACAAEADVSASSNNVKAGCFLRTRVPLKKFADFAILPVKKGGKPRNVVITRQKSQISQQLATVVAAKKARFFGDLSHETKRPNGGRSTSPQRNSAQKGSSTGRNAKSGGRNASQSARNRVSGNLAMNKFRDVDELEDNDNDAQSSGTAVRSSQSQSSQPHSKRERAESTEAPSDSECGVVCDGESEGGSSVPSRSSRRISTSKSILGSAMRRKEVANEASWRSTTLINRARPLNRISLFHRSSAPRSAVIRNTNWFSLSSSGKSSASASGRSNSSFKSAFGFSGASFVDKVRGLRLASRSYLTGTTPSRYGSAPSSSKPGELTSRRSSSRTANHAQSAPSAPDSSAHANASASGASSVPAPMLFCPSSSMQIAKQQQRRPNAVPTILQRGRSSVAAPPKRPVQRSTSAVGEVSNDASLSAQPLVTVATQRNESPVQVQAQTQVLPPPQLQTTAQTSSGTELLRSLSANSVTNTTSGTNRPLTALDLLKMRMKSTTEPSSSKPGVAAVASSVPLASVSSGLNSDGDASSRNTVLSNGESNDRPHTAVANVQRLSEARQDKQADSGASTNASVGVAAVAGTARKPATVLELLRFRQSQLKAPATNQ